MSASPHWVRAVVAAVAATWLVGLDAGSARAYEFEIRLQSIGQGYALGSLRFSGPDLSLARRRFTQTLSLDIWNIGVRPRRPYLRRPLGRKIYFTSYLRIDHDFGAWSTGSLLRDNRIVDAVDLVPELENGLLSLDLLYAYMAAEGLVDGLVDIRAGRQLEVGSLDWWSMDGISVGINPDLPARFEVFAGLRVRDASPLGSSVQEPDGTGSGECAEYVEGQIPGSGSWRPVDLQNIVENRRFANELDVCPQRQQLMPTFGGAVETRRTGPVRARLSYRRSMSPTPGIIGATDRFEYEDTGLYPNEVGQAPDWGVNEEKLAASVRSNHRFARGRGQISPYAAMRYDLLVAAVDQGHVGARLRYGAHAVEPELYYSLPTFDGDSIFNVFATEPYTDARITYDLRPDKSRLGAYSRVWLRRFASEDTPDAEPDAGGELTGGVQVGARYLVPRNLSARLDLFYDGGYGGTKTGAYAAATWQKSPSTGFSTRLSLVHFDELRGDLGGFSLGAQVGASYRINEGVTLRLVAEENSNRFYRSQFRLIGMLDLGFVPEV